MGKGTAARQRAEFRLLRRPGLSATGTTMYRQFIGIRARVIIIGRGRHGII